jgi:hypothetical protein
MRMTSPPGAALAAGGSGGPIPNSDSAIGPVSHASAPRPSSHLKPWAVVHAIRYMTLARIFLNDESRMEYTERRLKL